MALDENLNIRSGDAFSMPPIGFIQDRHDALEKLRSDGRRRITAQLLARAVNNTEFVEMLERSREPYERMMSYYRCALMEVETRFRILNEEFSMRHDRNPIENIKTRLKDADSLAEKVQRKGFEMSVESIEQNIYDVAGIRVVCAFMEDIYALAEALLSQDDVRLFERRDYLANPKPSGYRSLHLIIEVPVFLEHEKRYVKVEVQLRTISMNFWASLEHQLRYKKDISEEDATKIADELAALAKDANVLDLRMQRLRHYLDGSNGYYNQYD